MLSARTYVSIVLLFAVIFVLFMSVTLASDMLAEAAINSQAEREITVRQDHALLDNAFDEAAGRPVPAMAGTGTISVQNNPRAAIVVSPEDSRTNLLKEWCVYNKYRYRVFTQLPNADLLSNYDTVLFGEVNLTGQNLNTLEQYAATGIPMIFTQLPPYETLAAYPKLADFFGIKTCVSPSYPLDGVKLFGDFFLSKERLYTDNDFYGETDDMAISVPYYTLRAGYEVYAVAILEQQGKIKNEELPALLWRTYTGSSLVFVVNSDVFLGERLLGVITACLSQAYPCYLYPVVNAQTILLLNYPFFANENTDAIMERYSRNTRMFCRDVLWPNVVEILRNFGRSCNFFVAPQLDYADGEMPLDDDVVAYWKEIKKLSGVVGLSLGQVSSAALGDVLTSGEAFFQTALPKYRFTALYTGAFPADALRARLDEGQTSLLRHVTLMLSAFQENRRLFEFINQDVLSVMTTASGYQHESMDDIQMIAFETALGLCTQQVDFSRVLFPQGSGDDWSKLSRVWSAGDTYYNDYRQFDSTSVLEMESRIRNFLALNYSCEQTGNKLQIQIGNFNGEAWFVLRIHNAKIKNMTNGVAKRLSDTGYLICAKQASVTIELQKTNVLNPPTENGKR